MSSVPQHTPRNAANPDERTEPWPFGAELHRRRSANRLSIRKAAKVADISEGRWRQLETGVQRIQGQEFTIRTRPDTVVAVAEAVKWDPREALTIAGFDPDYLTVYRHEESVEPVPAQLWNALSEKERDALLNLMKTMVDARSTFDQIPDTLPTAEERGDATRVSYRPSR